MFAAASQPDEDLRQAKRTELDRACGAARQVALASGRQAIYEACINLPDKEEDECRRDANSDNGNRLGGTPLFYDLSE
jgi:hypothetical protein